jgi:hypothetical protein
MAELIAQQDMAVFVMDYDHNAPDVKYLRETHRPFFEIIRAKHPFLPVVFMSKCDYGKTLDDNDARQEVILQTYLEAKNSGDENVYFIDGAKFFEGARDICTVDGCHPNDIGFDRMFRLTEPVLRDLMNRQVK